MASDLRTEVVRGVGWTAAQKWAIRISGLLVFAALSRLLGPAQIGMGALALAVTSLLSVPLEDAVRSFLVRSRGADHRTEDTALWSAVGVSVLGIGVACAAAWVIRLMHGPAQLSAILVALSPIILITAVESVPSARLERELRFRSLAVREMVSAVCAGIAGVALAFQGAGVWALVAQAHVQAVVSLLLILKFAKWRPGLSFSRRTVGELARFGGPVVGVQLMQLVRDRGDQLLIGAILGLDVLGFWAIATRILAAIDDLSIALLDVVAFPVFVKIQDDAARLSRAYAIALSSCQSFLAPLLALVAATAPVLVPAVFGAQWAPATLPTQVLCLAYAIHGLGYLNRPMLRAAGKVVTELVFVSANQLMHVVVMLIVTWHGLVAVAVAMSVESVISVLVGAWLLVTRVGTTAPLPRQSIVTLGCGVAAAMSGLAVGRLGLEGAARDVAAVAGVTLAVFAGSMLVFNRALLATLAKDGRRLIRRAA